MKIFSAGFLLFARDRSAAYAVFSFSASVAMVSSPGGLSMTTRLSSSNTMLIRSTSTGKFRHDLRAKLYECFGRCFHLQTAAAAAEDDPVQADHAMVDI